MDSPLMGFGFAVLAFLLALVLSPFVTKLTGTAGLI